jgi:hypothetical protein
LGWKDFLEGVSDYTVERNTQEEAEQYMETFIKHYKSIGKPENVVKEYTIDNDNI